MRVGKLPKGPRLFNCEPIPKSHSQFFRTLHTPDTCCELWAQESCVSCLIGQSSHRSQSDVNGSRCQQLILKVNPITRDDGFVKGQPWFGTVPRDEIIDGTAITALRFR